MRRSVAEHQAVVSQLIGGMVAKLDGQLPQIVPLDGALGRVLAQDLIAPVSLPPFDNSQMDGFAVFVEMPEDQSKTLDSKESTEINRSTYTAAATIPAGVVPSPLEVGKAAPIMTGAMMPRGANAVVPVEEAIPSMFPAEGETLSLPRATAGSFVRERGSDLAEGSVAIPCGTLLNAAHIGLISALGLTHVPVLERPRVLLLTTGDEVLLPGDPQAKDGLPAGKIFDANMALLRANLQEAGLEVEVAEVIEDKPLALTQALETRLAKQPQIDLIISTGGISAGAFEVVKQALSGPDIDFLSVAMQPGGPQASGTFNGVPFLGFPGNPVSGVVSFELFLRPALTALLGCPKPRTRITAVLKDSLSSPESKHQIRRGILEIKHDAGTPAGVPVVTEVGGPSSHLLASLAQANALIHVPVGVSELKAGSEVEVWLL